MDPKIQMTSNHTHEPEDFGCFNFTLMLEVFFFFAGSSQISLNYVRNNKKKYIRIDADQNRMYE